MQAIGIHGASASAAKIASRCRPEDADNPVLVDRLCHAGELEQTGRESVARLVLLTRATNSATLFSIWE